MNRLPVRRRGAWEGAELVLGTAQLGLPHYGRANTVGRPDLAAAVALIQAAVEAGVDCLDTARAYDRSESVIGHAREQLKQPVQVVTKLDPLGRLASDASEFACTAAVDASVFRSCRELGLKQLPVLLLHRWQHRLSHDGQLWKRLLELRQEGVIRRLGVSVSSPEEALAALADPDVGQVQLPFNLLDHRWETAGVAAAAKARPEVVIHARSVLLQGLLGSGPERWPAIPGVDAEALVRELDRWARDLEQVDRVQLALGFVRGQDWIHALVIGLESLTQLHDLVARFQQPALDVPALGRIRARFNFLPTRLLDPAQWNAA